MVVAGKYGAIRLLALHLDIMAATHPRQYAQVRSRVWRDEVAFLRAIVAGEMGARAAAKTDELVLGG
jgi:hypothetical protein